MIVPDSNLILYAYNTDSPKHDAAKEWWRKLISGNEAVGLVHPVVFSFLRVSTSPRAFTKPLSLARSSELVLSWFNRKLVRLLTESPNHVSDVVKLLTAAGSTGGNLVVDAQIAALALAHKATVHTADHDFARFKGLNCHFPLDA